MDVAIAAVSSSGGMCLCNLPLRLDDDKYFVMMEVQKNENLLSSASKRLKDDKVVVLVAVHSTYSTITAA